ncbi:MAG TPA: hypothetical protein VI318_03470 [Baekduia sp.]
MSFFIASLHDGSPFLVVVVLAMLVSLIQHEAGIGTGITAHPCPGGLADEPELPRETLAQQITFGHERRCAQRAERAA